MNTIDIVRGMVTGYGLKALQIAATLLIVPFILSWLGTDRYGRIFTIMSAIGIMSLASDGLRLAFSRSIAQKISEGPEATARQMGGGLKAILLLVGSMAVVLLLLKSQVLGLLGVPLDDEYQTAFVLAVVQAVMESGAYCFGTYLTGRGRMDIFNAVVGAQVILRSIVFVVYFSHFEATADAYMAIWFAGALAANGALVLYTVRRWPDDFRGMSRGRMSEASGAVRYSLPLTLDSMQHYLLNHFSIPLVNRFIGPTEAGLLAIAINTISNNLAQLLFVVTRPLLVPVASRFDLGRMGPEKRALLLRVDSIFALCVFASMLPLAAAMPTVISLWLGADYVQLILPSQILVAGTAVSMSFSVRRSLLIGQGFGGSIVRASFPFVALAVIALGWALVVARDWIWVAGVISLFTAMTAVVAVGLVFEWRLLAPEAKAGMGTARRAVVGGLGGALAIYMSNWTPKELSLETLLPPLATLVFVLVATHIVLIPAGQVIDTLSRLKKGARKSLFEVPSADA